MIGVSSFKVNVCVAQHIGDRQEQQDRVAIITSPRNPGALLAIVADGMGGRTGGRIAADQVVATAENLFKDMTERDSTFRDMLLHLAAEAHTVIRLSAISAEKEPHSTLCALIVKKNYAIWAHAGDSRLYFFRGGRLIHRTEDHTYAEQLRLEGRHEDAELIEILHQLPPREASERLVTLARERAEGRGDNLSLAIIKLEPQPKRRG